MSFYEGKMWRMDESFVYTISSYSARDVEIPTADYVAEYGIQEITIDGCIYYVGNTESVVRFIDDIVHTEHSWLDTKGKYKRLSRLVENCFRSRGRVSITNRETYENIRENATRQFLIDSAHSGWRVRLYDPEDDPDFKQCGGNE